MFDVAQVTYVGFVKDVYVSHISHTCDQSLCWTSEQRALKILVISCKKTVVLFLLNYYYDWTPVKMSTYGSSNPKKGQIWNPPHLGFLILTCDFSILWGHKGCKSPWSVPTPGAQAFILCRRTKVNLFMEGFFCTTASVEAESQNWMCSLEAENRGLLQSCSKIIFAVPRQQSARWKVKILKRT